MYIDGKEDYVLDHTRASNMWCCTLFPNSTWRAGSWDPKEVSSLLVPRQRVEKLAIPSLSKIRFPRRKASKRLGGLADKERGSSINNVVARRQAKR